MFSIVPLSAVSAGGKAAVLEPDGEDAGDQRAVSVPKGRR